MVTTKDVEEGDEALLPYGEGWKPMLHLLTPAFRAKVMERYMFGENNDPIRPLAKDDTPEDETYDSDRSGQSHLDSDSEREVELNDTTSSEIDRSGGRQLRSLITYTLPDKSTYVVMMKDKKG